MIPLRPPTTEGRGSLWRFARAFRRDLLSALPERLYRAWMAEFCSPLIHSFVCNDPALIRLILKDRPGDFPKSNRLRAGLAPLLGASVFVTNGLEWAAQRRIIDPAFEGGRLHQTLPAIFGAADALVARLRPGLQDMEPETSFAAADVIFRALFSMPIEHETAARVFAAFRAHQEAQPYCQLGRPAALAPLAAASPFPPHLPNGHSDPGPDCRSGRRLHDRDPPRQCP